MLNKQDPKSVFTRDTRKYVKGLKQRGTKHRIKLLKNELRMVRGQYKVPRGESYS